MIKALPGRVDHSKAAAGKTFAHSFGGGTAIPTGACAPSCDGFATPAFTNTGGASITAAHQAATPTTAARTATLLLQKPQQCVILKIQSFVSSSDQTRLARRNWGEHAPLISVYAPSIFDETARNMLLPPLLFYFSNDIFQLYIKIFHI
jgi:hypothetical protein